MLGYPAPELSPHGPPLLSSETAMSGGTRSVAPTLSELMIGTPAGDKAAYDKEHRGARSMQAHIDRITGRRLPNGNLRLKTITPRHLKIVSLHLSGFVGNLHIAVIMKCTAATVNRVLNDPSIQEIIKSYHRGIDLELKALVPLAAEAIREGLIEGNIGTKLKSVDRLAKMLTLNMEQGGVGNDLDKSKVIEDAFFDALKARATKAKIIDGEATHVLDPGDVPSSAQMLEGHSSRTPGE